MSKKKFKIGRVLALILFIAVAVKGSMMLLGNSDLMSEDIYLGSKNQLVTLYVDKEKSDSITVPRGTKLVAYDVYSEDELLRKVSNDGETYFVSVENIVGTKEEAMYEDVMYVRTTTNMYGELGSTEILKHVNKKEELQITGGRLLEDGSVDWYQTPEGYIRAKYLVPTLEEASLVYDPDGYFKERSEIVNSTFPSFYENILEMDYYPREKVSYENNVMPEEAYTIYIHNIDMRNIEYFIDLAQRTKVNAFVIDLKESSYINYESDVANKYSPSMGATAGYTVEEFSTMMKKIQDAGIYTIGRVVVFKDKRMVADHPEVAITDLRTNEPLLHNSTYWPSAYSRLVWQYNTEFALEAIDLFGFNEIQFDYIRFPDRMQTLEKQGVIDYKNEFDETKGKVIQQFLMYAYDFISEKEVYVAGDVFGEAAKGFETLYGQYWPAVSNVVDVIAPMAYPDHFAMYEYDLKYPWLHPYEISLGVGQDMYEMQQVTPTPAVVRPWIEGYNTYKSNGIRYYGQQYKEQIQGYYDAGLKNGYMIWHAGQQTLERYEYEDREEALIIDYN